VIDDLDGMEATTSLTFAVSGVEYAIDLSEKNAAKFYKAVGPYEAPGARAGPAASLGQDLVAIRAWARENGFEVASRGRIPGTVAEAYQAAH